MRISRRKLLAATAFGAAIAGCIGSDDGQTAPDDGTADSEDDGRSTDSEPTDTDDSESDEDDMNGNDSTDGDSDADEPEAPIIQVRSDPEFDDILVDGEGMTLYNFDADEQGAGESSCYDDCAEAWPPLTVEDSPTVGDGVTANITTFEREDGELQVAANGWPVYYFASDENPGDSNGQGVNDVWWVLDPDGTPIRTTGDDDDENDDDLDADEIVTVGSGGEPRFEPDHLQIDRGTTVEFRWEADNHNLVVDEQPADATWDGVPEVQDAGYSHRHTFDVSGRYEYFCEPHHSLGMTGTIEVNGDSESATPSGPYSW